MTELSRDERKFIDAARSEWGPSAPAPPSPLAIRQRLLERPWLARAGTTPSSARLGLALSGLGICAVAIVLASRLVVMTPSTTEDVGVAALPSPTAHVPESSPMPSIGIDALPDARSVDDSVPRTKTPKAKAAPARPVDTSSAPGAEEDPLAFELQLVRNAQQALREDAPAKALSYLATHASRFPNGTLRDERMTLQVLARCALGDVSTAREIKSELERLSPDSSHLRRLSNSCAR